RGEGTHKEWGCLSSTVNLRQRCLARCRSSTAARRAAWAHCGHGFVTLSSPSHQARIAAAPRPSPFAVVQRDPGSAARWGQLRTAHGVVDTPTFMPVATQGTVKGVLPEQLVELGAQIVLANAYHLSLRPGVETVEAVGGLHRFMGWRGAILTDSGGYQIMSLAPLRRVSDEGVAFQSHVDGAHLFLTPEDVVERQVRLGGDIVMVLDGCVPASADLASVRTAMRRTTDWATRSARAGISPGQLAFAIVQGGLAIELRREHAGQLAAVGFPGYAVGG